MKWTAADERQYQKIMSGIDDDDFLSADEWAICLIRSWALTDKKKRRRKKKR